ncbi:GMC family oxidoreductase [Aspergillus puulaauensis]|uniref:Glucose-methanol-choline oxidoreductase N-terminal domain-containing protein n=1 Tax=Aspergillus puulaauensis TaxID=1220207 RepID=A0A7R7XR25_9EURO|nr:uncharacterized protein APUU_41658S [Aspergillus puulaauensis]BCS25214.1 hypothetical protein APUU_41658S [Aspergillus puulaauensis]
MGSNSNRYDFIVVGAGPAGCTVASSLANSKSRPKVLLLEAGGKNDAKSLRVDGQRWSTQLVEHTNWGYKTAPQRQCNNRELPFSRGKGLGGSTAINFGTWAFGARDDYDKWAEDVGDDAFSWERVQERLKALECLDEQSLAARTSNNTVYAAPKPTHHGFTGPLRVGFAREFEADLPLVLDIFDQAGFERNLDVNDGNPLGMSLGFNSFSFGLRSTAADLLVDIPDNLMVITDQPVQRVVFDGQRAVGVELKNAKYFVTKEVILCAGTVETPKILMHSGIGPASELQKFHIPIVCNIPAIGQNLIDHFLAPFVVRRNPQTNDRNSFFRDQKAMHAAMEQWEKDGSGPWARYGCQIGAGWFKSDRLSSSEEFKLLPESVKEFLNRETIPHYELITHFPIHFVLPDLFGDDYSYLAFAMIVMNQQSCGKLRLQSADPDEPLLIDPNFLDHAFDRRACIETFRHMSEVINHPSFAKDTTGVILGPDSDSDEGILEYWRQNGFAGLHAVGTVKMGRPGDPDAAVDSRFRVFGVEGLRVADLSAVPFVPNNHTQTTAYVTGATCAEVLLEDYNLD